MFRKMSHKLRSLASTQIPQSRPASLRLESLEDRLAPATSASLNADQTILTIQFDAGNADNEIIVLDNDGGQLRATPTINPFTTSPDGAADPTYTAPATVQMVVVNGLDDVDNWLDLTTLDLAGIANLRTVTYLGTLQGDFVDATANTNDNLYFNIRMRGGPGGFDDGINIGAGGVYVLHFDDQPAGAQESTFIQTNAANDKVALSFKDVTSSVNADLNVSSTVAAPAVLANYAGMQVFLTGASSGSQILGLFGGQGDDVLIGNDKGNVLIGYSGSDTLVGNGGNDELAANRAFSPAYAGTNNGGVAETNPTTTIYNLDNWDTATSQFNAETGITQTTRDLYAAFGFFNFGEGGSFLADGSVSFAEDFAAANAVDAEDSQDFLYGGDGNDGLYGFNGAAVIAYGQVGDDVFSSNTEGLNSSYDGGAGNDFMVGLFGSTLNGGDDDDVITWVGDPVAATALSYGFGGAGNDLVALQGLGMTADVGTGSDQVAVAVDDASNILIINALTTGFNPAALFNTQVVVRPVS